MTFWGQAAICRLSSRGTNLRLAWDLSVDHFKDVSILQICICSILAYNTNSEWYTETCEFEKQKSLQNLNFSARFFSKKDVTHF